MRWTHDPPLRSLPRWVGRGAGAPPSGGSSSRSSAATGGLAAPAAAAAAAAEPDDPWLVREARFEPLDAAPLGVDGVGEYRGSIRITRSGAGVGVVNALPLDDYLRGISEVPSNWPIEAQKAQAIAARTYALHEVGREVNAAYKQAGADICATDACQVYAGLAKERRPGSERWSAAVESTTGQVLVYQGAPIVAKYSSSNGGQTVGGGQPYLRATPDPDDAYSPLHQWRSTFPLADVARVVGLAAEPTALRTEGDVIVATSLDPDGNPVEQRLPATDFRSRINSALVAPAGLPVALPSTRFAAVAVDGLVVIDGRGWGHGIGLSQYGALGKAIRGLKAADILAAYYSGLRPVAVPADQLPPQVRVAVALDRAEAWVHSAGGRFRVVDADGRVVAHRATGAWRATPAPNGRIRLVPPTDEAGAPGAALTTAEPAAAHVRQAVALRIELQGPAALTRITLTNPAGATTELDPSKLRASGPLTVRLGAATTSEPGPYRVDFERDAGAGRVVTVPVVIDVAPAEAKAPAAVANPGGTGRDRPAALVTAGTGSVRALQGLATVLLLAVVAAGAAWMGRRPGIELH